MTIILSPLFILDWATCNNYFSWFYECDKNEHDKRKNLTDLHLASAMEKANSDNTLIIIPNNTSEKIIIDYEGRMAEIDTFLGAVDIENLPQNFSQVVALVKLSVYYSLTKRDVYIVVSDKYIYDILKRQIKLNNVIDLDELGIVLKKHNLNS